MERAHLRTGVIAGLLAGAVMLLFLLAFRLALGTPSIPELGSDWFTGVLPPRLFSRLLDTLLTAGKPLLYLGEAAVMLATAALVGVLYARAGVRWPRLVALPWRSGLMVGVAAFLLIGLGIAPLFGVGPFGMGAVGGAVPFILATLGYSLAFGLALTHLYWRSVQARASSESNVTQGRRAFLRRAALWAGGVALVGGGGRLVAEALSRATPSRYTAQSGTMPPAVTPNADFYTVSKNILDPFVDPSGWGLAINGLVDKPLMLTLDELRALDAVEQYVTLECISNPVGGSLISNALWRGVPLARLLERAGLRDGVKRLVFHAADGYSDTLPLEDARREEVLVAYEMNGTPLSREHGQPARLLVPGRYGVKSVKWLTRVEASDKDNVRGFWQERGWDDEAMIKTMSRIDVPPDGAKLTAGVVMVGGVTFAGARGVRQVEVSGDDGRTWSPAALEPALSPYTWVLWTAEWDPPAPGIHWLAVRTTDGRGVPQTVEVQEPFPTGATGLHRVYVKVM